MEPQHFEHWEHEVHQTWRKLRAACAQRPDGVQLPPLATLADDVLLLGYFAMRVSAPAVVSEFAMLVACTRDE